MNGVSGAEEVLWDLSDLYSGGDDPQIEKDLSESQQRAQSFASSYRGRIGEMDAAALARLLGEYEEILELSGKAGTFTYLNWSTNTEDPARGALLQRLQEHSSQLQQQLLFFELEWAHVEDKRAQELMADEALAHYSFWLTLARRYRPHLRSEAEEKILAEKSVTGRSAWIRFFDEVHGGARYTLDNQQLPQQSVLTKLYDPDRVQRKRAAEAFTTGLQNMRRVNTYVFNNLLADKASDDRLRSYPSWISSRNLANQIDDATVEALVKAVTDRYGIVARYYTLKKKLLGLDELLDYDRYAPLPSANRRYPWQEAMQTVLDSYAGFHQEMGRIAESFFSNNWIDAAVQPGKRGGAYSHGAVPSVHPYIFMNFEGTPRDVMTLAHEMGHGVHQYLSRDQGILLSDTPLTTAETASVFGEMLVFQKLIAEEKDPRIRLSMLVQKIEDTFATVFRQTAMNRFEEAIHTARRSDGELTAERFSELWMKTQNKMFEESVTLTDNYGIWWSYIPHFIHSPGYVYAYAFGELLVLALYSRYQDSPEGFPAAYRDLLAAGGSNWPEELVRPLGVDLKDPKFWDKGLSMIEGFVEQAEAMAEV
ncbi:MAG: M3 family oligoendopeptidase [Spirochaetaceae bacterium]|nr:MAG: M3 family oligoendopeptidase [Spirochaetaceae bacterium]